MENGSRVQLFYCSIVKCYCFQVSQTNRIVTVPSDIVCFSIALITKKKPGKPGKDTLLLMAGILFHERITIICGRDQSFFYSSGADPTEQIQMAACFIICSTLP
jgi:hypothetical protein